MKKKSMPESHELSALLAAIKKKQNIFRHSGEGWNPRFKKDVGSADSRLRRDDDCAAFWDVRCPKKDVGGSEPNPPCFFLHIVVEMVGS